ncbi:hypothetical protein IAT38_004217 [Cryptococcus sp. DSM 104549]
MSFLGTLCTLWQWLSHQINATFHSGFPWFFWVQPTWSVGDIPDLTGKVALITGANSGTGYATALALYNAGATVYLACRSLKRAEEAADDIRKGGDRGVWGTRFPDKELDGAGGKRKGKVEVIQLDLTDLGSVEKCAEEFQEREKRLDLLFANAGIMATPEGLHTKQGYTLQFGTNVLGHHYLINSLLPLLLSRPPSDPARVILTSSAGHALAPKGGINYASVVRDPSDPPALTPGSKEKPVRGKNELDKWTEYGQSKWGNVALAKWLWAHYGRQGRIIATAVHPGLVATNLASHFSLSGLVFGSAPWLRHLITRDPSVGAINQIYAGTVSLPEAWYLNGEYVVPFNTIGVARPDLNDIGKANELWDWCTEQEKKFA